MTHEDFCVWLKGFIEVQAAEGEVTITPQQVNMIEKHLKLVFKYQELQGAQGVQGAKGVKGKSSKLPPPHFPETYCSPAGGKIRC